LTNVAVRDFLPAGLNPVFTNPVANIAGQNVDWTVASLASGESVYLWVTVDTIGMAPGLYKNCAQVLSMDVADDVDSVEGNMVVGGSGCTPIGR
jgi:hypothetical protein